MSRRKARRVTARYQWDRMKVSFWFAPAVMSVGAVLLAWAMYRLDAFIPNDSAGNEPFHPDRHAW